MARHLENVNNVISPYPNGHLESPFHEDGSIRKSEIIQVGMIGVTLGREIDMSFSKKINVIPVNTQINDFCLKITNSKLEDYTEGAVTFEEAVSQMNVYNKWPWASWGTWDKDLLIQQCIEHQNKVHKIIGYPFSNKHSDLKLTINGIIGVNKMVGLRPTMEYLGIPFEGKEHDAEVDAYNTFLLFQSVFQKTRTLFQNIIFG